MGIHPTQQVTDSDRLASRSEPWLREVDVTIEIFRRQIAGGIKQADLHVGYPKGPVAPGGAIDRLMDRHLNLYGDLSSSGAHAVLRDRKFGEQFLTRRAERLLFGTDYYDQSQTELSQFHLFDEFKLPPMVVDSISRTNAERILSIA